MTLPDLLHHAERFGPDEVYETAVTHGLGEDDLETLAEALSKMPADPRWPKRVMWRRSEALRALERHPHLITQTPQKQGVSEPENPQNTPQSAGFAERCGWCRTCGTKPRSFATFEALSRWTYEHTRTDKHIKKLGQVCVNAPLANLSTEGVT